ncbi:MAG: serine/threonine-protein kinase [Chloroflexota bacterium]
MPYTPGDIIFGKYRIESLLGQGAFGDVYRCSHLGLGITRALKVMRRDTPGHDSTSFNDGRLRFQLEARLGARLNNPNPNPHLLQVFDLLEDTNVLILEMEYAPGGSLAQRIQKTRENGILIPISETLQIGADIAAGLGALHNIDIIHRDVKPGNILFDEYGYARLADLGLAQIPGGPSMRSQMSIPLSHPGTPGYTSPEQNNSTDLLRPPSDIFSLGIVLFEMLTGRSYTLLRPGTRAKTLRAEIPVSLDNLLAIMLSRLPEDRPWDGYETETKLRKQLSNYEKIEKKPISETNSKDIKPFPLSRIPIWFENFSSAANNQIKSLFSRKKPQQYKIEVHSKTLEEWKESGPLTVNLMAVLEPQRQKQLLTLINREQELRIKDIIVPHGGGRYLLHGFGRFGASALIDQIVEQARKEIRANTPVKQQGIVMMVRVELSEADEENKVFGAIVRDFRFEAEKGKYAKSILRQLEKFQKKNFANITESSVENSISIKATPIPGLETSFSRKSDKTINPIDERPSENGIVDVISKFLDRSEGKKLNLLEKLIEKIANTSNTLSRIIIVLDKIDSAKTFKILQNVRLFSDDRITFFAIVKEEVLLSWGKNIYQMLNGMGFRDYYIPCVWEEEFHLIKDIVRLSAFSGNEDDQTIENFINHVAYVTKGAPGDVVKELVDPAYNTFNQGVPRLSLESIRDERLIKYNAWRQRFLSTHWNAIIGEDYLTQKEKDRAKIGVYELMEEVRKLQEFGLSEVAEIFPRLQVTPCDSRSFQTEIMQRLLENMVKEELLKAGDQGRFIINLIMELALKQLHEKYSQHLS